VKAENARSLAWILLLATALAGCGARIKGTEYPVAWPARVEKAGNAECVDITGSYKAGTGDSLLPFFLFGINETSSREWSDLVQVNEQVLAAPDDSTVSIGLPDSDRMEVVVAVRGTPIARQFLQRSHLSASTAEMWLGQGDRTFRCNPDSIVTVGASVSDWTRFRLPYEERKRLYKRRDIRHAGTSHGYFDFSKAVDGSLVMRERRFFCVDCGKLDHRWRRWEPVSGFRGMR
jgi:hypothetical protein